MRAIRDKRQFSTFLRQQGFAAYVPAEFAQAQDVSAFPVIVKPVNGHASFGVELVTTPKRLEEAQTRLLSRGYQSVIQEFIPSAIQQTVHIAAVNGRLLRMICIERKLKSAHAINKAVRYSREGQTLPDATPNSECFQGLIQRVIRALDYTGIGNFDVRATSNATHRFPKIIEMNGRIPGTLRTSARVLADFICAIQGEGEGRLTANGCVVGAVPPGSPNQPIVDENLVVV
jgi:D-alanine-D-alanine ligase-like ATP-grasp enzyme